MKVAMYYKNSDVRLEEMPIPKINSGEVLVKIHSSGICGSDCLEWYRIKKAPIVLGHEIAGEIVEVGNDVKGYKTGQRVFVSHHIPCNTCRYCLTGHHTACETLHTTNFSPGGFSEYLKVPKLNVDRGIFVLPDSMTYDEGTFIEPLGCVVRAQRLANFKPSQNILILGGGISGIIHLLLAKACGAGNIIVTDISESRLETAKKFGASVCINAKDDIPSIVKKCNGGFLADHVVVCTGALSAFKQALKSVERGGKVLFFAATEPNLNLELPVSDIWRNDITLMPSYGAAPEDLSVAIDLIKNKRVDVAPMVTHKLPLRDAQLGFNLVSQGKDSLKVIIEPQK